MEGYIIITLGCLNYDHFIQVLRGFYAYLYYFWGWLILLVYNVLILVTLAGN